MQRLMLVLFIASELCYYLLIAQTGVIEYFSSNIYQIAPLPIGGIIGSILCVYIKTTNLNKILGFLSIQLIMSLFYPDFSQIMLFILGLSVGALAPLLINELKKATSIDLGLALALSYTVGTFLFNYEPSERGFLAIGLTLVAIVSSVFIYDMKNIDIKHGEFSLSMMVLWVFLDSALFETLSRDLVIPIWRGGFSTEIVLFHIIGIFVALRYKMTTKQKELFIIILFSFSYLFYFIREAYLLSIIYPFVISYYNVTILHTILRKNFKTISVYMVFIGWIASGIGLFVALEGIVLFIPVIFMLVFFKIIIFNTNQNYTIQNKEIQNV